MASSDKALVLLVDDFPDAREMYSEYLAFAGYRVAEAANGQEALEQAAKLRPDLVLMDLSMPVMDGWEATRRLKANPKTAKIPVVALTGHALDGTSDEARAAGCDDFIAKPCLPQDLVGKIATLLARGAAPAKAPRAAAARRTPTGSKPKSGKRPGAKRPRS